MFLMEWGLFVTLSYIAPFVIMKGETEISGYGIFAILNGGNFFER
jgi:hypothetical protein